MSRSVMTLIRKTLPFFLSRIVVYLIFAVASLVFLGIMIGAGYLVVSMFGDSGVAFIFVLLITFGFIYGGLRFVERYVLYMVKVAHISVIAELLTEEKIPDGKNQIAYGKDKVTENFGTANVAFAVDALVHAAVKQIQRWILRVGRMFRFIPGSDKVIGIINAVMGIALNYIDEAVVSYIFIRQKKHQEESVWKSASDGVVLYAQGWKGILKTAAFSVAFIYAFNIIIFLLLAFPAMFLANMITINGADAGFLFGAIALIAAYILTTVLKRAFIDPVVMIAMVRSYHFSTQDMQPEINLQEKLQGVSKKFKELFQKGEQENKQPTG